METLDLWDEQLVAAGIALMQSRAVFLEQLNEICVEKYASLTGQKARGHGKAAGRIPSHGSSAACLPSSTCRLPAG